MFAAKQYSTCSRFCGYAHFVYRPIQGAFDNWWNDENPTAFSPDKANFRRYTPVFQENLTLTGGKIVDFGCFVNCRTFPVYWDRIK